jgi:hypothetical protein
MWKKPQTKILFYKKWFFFSIVNPKRCSNFSNLFYFWDNTLHVSDGLSVHHQEFKTVHTATGICQTDTAVCLLLGTRWNKQIAVSVWHIPVAVCTVLNSWWWTEIPPETCRVLSQKWDKFEKWLHLVGFTTEIYCDAVRSYERQMCIFWFILHNCKNTGDILSYEYNCMHRNNNTIPKMGYRRGKNEKRLTRFFL